MPSSPACPSRRWSPRRCAPTSTRPTPTPTPTPGDGDQPKGRPDMTTEGIEAVFLETHNWGRAAACFQSLGFTLDFETDHASGQLRNGDGPYVFVAEIPEDRGQTPWLT